jgi:hypothetical protein
MRKLFSPIAVTVPVSGQYITTGLSIVLYIFMLVLLFRNFNSISFASAQNALLPSTVLSAISVYQNKPLTECNSGRTEKLPTWC